VHEFHEMHARCCHHSGKGLQLTDFIHACMALRLCTLRISSGRLSWVKFSGCGLRKNALPPQSLTAVRDMQRVGAELAGTRELCDERICCSCR
jgi:hypothetical protein